MRTATASSGMGDQVIKENDGGHEFKNDIL
jgi:hypothetical protein